MKADDLTFDGRLLDGLFDDTPQFGIDDGLFVGKGCCSTDLR